MNIKLILTIVVVTLTLRIEGKRTSSWSRGSSGRGHSSGSYSGGGTKYANTHKTNTQASSSLSQAAAQKPSYTGWQQKPAQSPSSSQSHSYPKPAQPPGYQESVQKNYAQGNTAHQKPHTNNQAGHSYPSSTGLSGSSGNGQPAQHGAGSGSPQQYGTGLSGNSGNGYQQQHGTGLSGASGGSYPHQTGTGLSGNTGGNYPQQHGTGLSGSGSGYPQPGSGLSGRPAAPPPYSGYRQGQSYPNNNPNYYHPQGPPPPYTSSNFGGYNPSQVQQMPGYFGNYGNMGKSYGGVSRGGSALKGVGMAGVGIGTVLTGLALWNLARSTGQHHHTVIYDNRGQPVAVAPNNSSAPSVDPMLADLVNCSLTISNENTTDVLAIPCAIATSFSPEADIKDSSVKAIPTDNTTCTVTVLTKTGKEFMTTIPCSILFSTAAENNVTEPLPDDVHPNDSGNVTITNVTNSTPDFPGSNSTLIEPTALKLTGGDLDPIITLPPLNCTMQIGENRDPINPCYSVQHNLTVIPLSSTDTPHL